MQPHGRGAGVQGVVFGGLRPCWHVGLRGRGHGVQAMYVCGAQGPVFVLGGVQAIRVCGTQDQGLSFCSL